jgi:hypothetical protein
MGSYIIKEEEFETELLFLYYIWTGINIPAMA